MRPIRRLLRRAAAAALLLGLAAFAMRFADGPIGPFPGGALSGTVDPEVWPDWSTVGSTVELEIRPGRPWSLHAYAIPSDGELYVPSFLAERRRWVPVALADPRVRVRVGERVYERRIERVNEPATRARLIAVMAERHGYDPLGIVARDTTWYFRLAPR